MPRRSHTQPEFRKVTVSGYMASYLQGFLNAEAGRLGLAPSALIEKAVESFLRNAGYPVDEVIEAIGDVDQDRKEAFLKVYESSGGTIGAGCREAAISATTVYQWIGEDKEFASRFALAKARRNPMPLTHSPIDNMQYAATQGKKLIRGRRKAQVVNPDGSIDESGL